MNTNTHIYPSYLRLRQSELKRKIDHAYTLMKECRICPRECGAKRLKGEVGYCRAGAEPEVSSFHPHHGEEPPVSGRSGSGTIFLTHCNLRCVFCQNYPISHLGHGNKVTTHRLANFMLALQKRGCHNINFVTPTHFVPQILAALYEAINKGLKIPLVYNCSGYEKVETLQVLNDIIDIYLPDIKYGGTGEGEKYSNAPDYFEVAKQAVKEMYSQVGNLQISSDAVARRGLIIRHLILPNKLAKTKNVLSFIKEEISPRAYISLMSQYFPAHNARDIKELNRKITPREYSEALRVLEKLNLENGWRQI